MTWITVNVLLTLLALAYARFNATVPHRLRFFVCFSALCGWLIPWGRIAPLMPARPRLPDLVTASLPLRTAPEPLPGATSDAVETGLAWLPGAVDGLVLAAAIVGVALCIGAIAKYADLVRRLRADSVPGDELWALAPLNGEPRRRRPELRIQRHVTGALTTGLFVPTIWIHEDLVTDPAIGAAILHEYRHVELRDNAYLWVITLIERLLWWNPLARHLGARVRHLQELSCDEACARECTDYPSLLNRLILSLSRNGSRPANCPQIAFVWAQKNFNIERLRMLERRYAMSTKAYVSTGLLVAGVTLVLGLAGAQSSDDATEQTEPLEVKFERAQTVDETLQQLPELGPISGFDPDTTMAEANEIYRGLKLYVTLLERQYDRLDEQHKSLLREFESLQANVQAGDPAGTDGDSE